MRKILFLLVVGLLLALTVLPACRAAPEKTIKLIHMTAYPGTSAYVKSAAWAEVIEKHIGDRITMAVVPGKGGVELTDRLRKGWIHIGTADGGLAYQSLRGKGPWEGEPLDVVRALIPYGMTPGHLIVLEGSPIKSFTVADLKGKKIATTKIGGVVAATMFNSLRFIGLDPEKDIKAYHGSYAEGFDSLKDKIVDAAWHLGAYPQPLVELAATHKFRLISVPPEVVKAMNEEFYEGMRGVASVPLPEYWVELFGDSLLSPKPGPTIAMEACYTASKEVDEEVAYEIVKVFWEHKAEAEAICDSWKYVTPEDLKVVPYESCFPYHPGALRYYREKGWLD